MPIKEAVKIALAKEDISLTELVKKLNKKYNRNDTIQNLSKKINNGTLKYREAEEIAAVLGFEIVWTKKE